MTELDNRLSVARSGGLAGLQAAGEASLDELSPNQRSELDALLQAKVEPAAPGADRFTYRVTVTHGGKSQSRAVPEHAVPRWIAALVQETLPDRK